MDTFLLFLDTDPTLFVKGYSPELDDMEFSPWPSTALRFKSPFEAASWAFQRGWKDSVGVVRAEVTETDDHLRIEIKELGMVSTRPLDSDPRGIRTPVSSVRG